jgi:hypothetical protein
MEGDESAIEALACRNTEHFSQDRQSSTVTGAFSPPILALSLPRVSSLYTNFPQMKMLLQYCKSSKWRNSKFSFVCRIQNKCDEFIKYELMFLIRYAQHRCNRCGYVRNPCTKNERQQACIFKSVIHNVYA